MTLFLTVGVRDTNHRDEFHITTFFRVRFAKGVSLLSTSEFLLWSYSNKTFRTKAFFIGITFGGESRQSVRTVRVPYQPSVSLLSA